MISYEQPNRIDTVPFAFEGKGYPYNSVADPRRFEELLYSIYKIKISRGEFLPYDTISLLNGVREKGRDCALLKDGRNHGLIQCKKYEKSLNREQLGKEITKFVLYSLLEPTLISDPQRFEYYVAVAGGMTNDCIAFIDEFRHQILTEPNVNDWIDYNLESKTLAPLKIQEPHAKVLAILSAIHVKKILPQDLDILLAEPAIEPIVPLFFKVRTVTDNSHIIELKEDFKRFTGNRLDTQQIESELKKGSTSLRGQKNELEEIPDSHIDRAETSELLEWIKAPCEKDKSGREKNICLLAGDPGIGKTVILKDLYEELANEKTPVLALKADKLYPANMQDLQHKANLSLPVIDFVEQCKQHFDTTIILIDQIDALSQSMSSDRNFLHVFRQLIDYYTHDSSIRVIISVRKFDLEYDPSLKIYKDIKQIKVGLLSEVEVRQQLAKIKVTGDALNPKLLQLLRTPNHLNIFSIVFAKKGRSLTGYSTIQDLYSELWLQKIMNAENTSLTAEQLKSVLYRIGRRMFQDQRIALSRQLFEDAHQELLYLERERLLKLDGNQIQFFHQSFYDYVFAKDFVESGESLISYIVSQKQTILIRSAVKMIVGYLRDFDHSQYIRQVKILLKGGRIYFHIKHLLISLLAVTEEPTSEEQALFMDLINKNISYKTVFFEHAYGTGWSHTVFKKGVLDFLIEAARPPKAIPLWQRYLSFRKDKEETKKTQEYLQNAVNWYLRSQLSLSSDQAFDFILQIKDQNLVRWLSFTMDDWSHPKALQLFHHCENFRETDPYGYYHSLEHLIPTHPEFVLEQVKDTIFFEDYYEDQRNEDHRDEKKVVKDLSDKAPFLVLPLLLKNLDHQVHHPRLADLDFNGDYKYKDVYLNEETDIDRSSGLLYKLLAVCLRQAAEQGHDLFIQFIKDFSQDTNESYLRLLIFSYQADVRRYATPIADLLHHLHRTALLESENRLNIEYRMLFEKAFPHFSKREQADALKLIRQLRIKNELIVYHREGKKRYYLNWGEVKYLFMTHLPPDAFEKDNDLRKEFLELKRKFPGKVDKHKFRSNIAQAVRRPLPHEAYTKMSPDNWIRSFKKYDSDERNWGEDYLKGGLHEHSWAFKEYISKNPTPGNIELVRRVVADPAIHPDYKVRGIYGLTEAHTDPHIVRPLVEQMLEQKQNHLDQSLFLSSVGYLFQMDCYNDKLVDFAIHEALNGETPKHWADKEEHKETSIIGLVTAAINSSKGKAAEYLCFVNQSAYEERIFSTLDELLAKDCPQVRAVIYYRYAYLMRVNDKRAFNLFVNHLDKEENMEVIASAIWSLQYLSNYDFDRLEYIFTKLIHATNIGDEDSRALSTILFISWLKGKDNAGKLYKEFLARSDKRHFWAVHDAFEYFYLYEDSPAKCLESLYYLLDIGQPNEESKSLNMQFYKLPEIKFADIRDFIAAYINSRIFRLTDDLTKYLISSCKDAPFECVDLFSAAIARKEQGQKQNGHYRDDDHATQFIIAGFSAIKDNDKKSQLYREKLLKSFDRVLEDHKHRTKVERILDAI